MDVQRGEVLCEREVTELALEAAVRRDVAHRHQAERLRLILNNPKQSLHILDSLLHF